MNITYFDFEATVRENAGEVLVTSGGLALFHIAPSTDGVEFTPMSTGKPRAVQAKDIQRYLDVFNQTQSTNTSDYQANFRNASYVLSVIQLCHGQQRVISATNDGTSEAEAFDPNISVPEGDIKVRSGAIR